MKMSTNTVKIKSNEIIKLILKIAKNEKNKEQAKIPIHKNLFQNNILLPSNFAKGIAENIRISEFISIIFWKKTGEKSKKTNEKAINEALEIIPANEIQPFSLRVMLE